MFKHRVTTLDESKIGNDFAVIYAVSLPMTGTQFKF
jgi:hypothetical protein